MKIQVTQTLPNGRVTQQVLSKDGAEVLKIQAQPGAKLSFNVEAGKPAGTVATKPKTGDIKKIGNNLVLESEGEALVEVSDFYSNAGASVGDVGWNYAATNVAATEATPEAQAMAADTAVAGSGALLPVIAPGWLVAGGVAAIAAGSSGGGGSNTSTSTPPNEGGGTPNNPPTAVNLTNAVASVAEVANNVATSARIKVADINVVDADGGNNNPYTVSNANYFEADATGLYIKAGVVLDHETLKTLSTTVTANGVTSSAISVAVTDVNDAPTLTTVSTLTGFAKGAYKEISYADLAAAGNEADPENSALSFRVETVSTGTLQKWNATTSAWDSVVAGSTLVAAGEKLQWKAADGSSGTALNAFTIKAWDGALASAEAVQVKADVAASSGGGGGGGASSNVVSGLITAGPVVATHGLSVELFKADGSTLGVATVAATGRFSKDVGTYTGVVLAKVIDSSLGADYKDEATGLDVDLGATLMAVGVISGISLTLNINPLTTIAAQKAGLAADGTGAITGATDADKVISANNANAAVASAFGLSNITSTDPDTTNDATTATNPIGVMLAALSGQDAITGSAQTTINNFVAGITTPVTATVGVLSGAAQTAVLQGAAMADPAGTLGLVNAVSDGMSAAVTTTGFTIGDIATDNIIKPADGLSATTTITGTAATGTTQADLGIKFGATTGTGAFVLTGTSWTYTLSAADVTALTLADGALAVELIVATVITGRRMVLVDMTDDAPAAVTFANQTTVLAENADISAGAKLADIVIADFDGYMGAAPTVSDTSNFEIKTVAGKYELWLKSTASINYETVAGHAWATTVMAGGATSQAFTLAINNVNEAPTGTNATITIAEDMVGGRVLTAADFGFADASDNQANALAAVIITTLPTAGTLKLNGVAVTAGQSIAVADLPHLIFAPALNANGNGYATIGFKVQDDGGTANGGVDTSVAANTLTINVAAENDAPVNTVPGAMTVNEDTDLAITGLSVADIDAASSNITVTLSAAHGTITVAAATGVTLGTNGTASVTLTGALTDINAALAATNGVVYKGALNYNGSDTLTMLTSDGGNTGSGGTLTDSDTVAITVTAVNDTPTSTVTAGVTTAAASATFAQAYDYNAQAVLGFADVEDTTLTYSLVGAPSWLSINASGHIVGTAPTFGSTGAPIEGQVLSFKVRATDTGTLYAERDVSVTIYNNPQILSITRSTSAGVDASGNTATTGAVDFAIVFNKTDVLNASKDDFTVTFTPSAGGAPSTIAAADLTLTQGTDAAQYTLTVGGSAVAALGDGTLSITAVGGDIKDSANNNVNTTLPTGANQQVYVLDHVNQTPIFASSTAIATAINEGTASSTVIYTANATDPDLTAPNKTLAYSIGGTDGSKFDINAGTGAVSLKSTNSYDYETQSSYSFTVTATDGGTGALNATQTVTLAINNVNEAPTVSPTSISDLQVVAGSTSSTSTPLINMSTYFTDPDTTPSFNTLTYSLHAGAPAWLAIEGSTGKVYNTTASPSSAAANLAVTVDVFDGLSTVSKSFQIDVVEAPKITNAAVLDGQTSVDVTSNFVFKLDQAVDAFGTAATKYIRIKNDANGGGKDGYKGEQTAEDILIDVHDTTQVTVSSDGLTVTVNPTAHLDLSNNYHIEVDAGAFVSRATSLGSVGIADNTTINFSTVTPADSTVSTSAITSAALSKFISADGLLMTDGKYWIDIEDRSSPIAAAQQVDAGSGATNKDFVFVFKDYDRNPVPGGPGPGDNGIGTDDFFVRLFNFGYGDLLYVDSKTTDSNRVDLTTFTGSSTDTLSGAGTKWKGIVTAGATVTSGTEVTTGGGLGGQINISLLPSTGETDGTPASDHTIAVTYTTLRTELSSDPNYYNFIIG